MGSLSGLYYNNKCLYSRSGHRTPAQAEGEYRETMIRKQKGGTAQKLYYIKLLTL
jgi:hypothetical protein